MYMYIHIQIVLVGEIMEVNESPTNVMYKIDDRSGQWVEVRKWMDENVREVGKRTFPFPTYKFVSATL